MTTQQMQKIIPHIVKLLEVTNTLPTLEDYIKWVEADISDIMNTISPNAFYLQQELYKRLGLLYLAYDLAKEKQSREEEEKKNDRT